MSADDRALPGSCYRDPSLMVDRLREVDRHLKAHTAPNCAGCRFSLGRVFGHDVCDIKKRRDTDGYCEQMRQKGIGHADVR